MGTIREAIGADATQRLIDHAVAYGRRREKGEHTEAVVVLEALVEMVYREDLTPGPRRDAEKTPASRDG